MAVVYPLCGVVGYLPTLAIAVHGVAVYLGALSTGLKAPHE